VQTVRRSYSWVIAIAVVANLISFAGYTVSSSLPAGINTELVHRKTLDSKSSVVSYTNYLLSKEHYAPLFLTLSYSQIENIISKRCNATIKVQNLSIGNSLVASTLIARPLNRLRKDPVDDYLIV